MKKRRALSIRQPYVEMIIGGRKTVEFRRNRTHIIGETFYLYASAKPGAEMDFRRLGKKPGELPTGLIIGTAKIARCEKTRRRDYPWNWHLVEVHRLRRPLKPANHPQPIWFNPY